MALAQCAECGQETSGAASACPHCGYAEDPKTDRTRKVLLRAYNIGCLAILALLTIVLVYRLVPMFL